MTSTEQNRRQEGGEVPVADGPMGVAGGQDCPRCDKHLGIADRFCRWCGTRLRPDSPLGRGSTSKTVHVVYMAEEDRDVGRFLDIAVGQQGLTETMDKWWKAFETGEKEAPEGYTGIHHRPVAGFDERPGRPGGDDDVE